MPGNQIKRNYGSNKRSFTIKNRRKNVPVNNSAPMNVNHHNAIKGIKNTVRARRAAHNIEVGKKEAIRKKIEDEEEKLKAIRAERRRMLAKSEALDNRAQKLIQKSQDMLALAQNIRTGKKNLSSMTNKEKSLIQDTGLAAEMETLTKERMEIEKEVKKMEEKEEEISDDLAQLMGSFNKVRI